MTGRPLRRAGLGLPDRIALIRVRLGLSQGFEDLEAVTILDVCGWTAYRPNLPKILVTTTGFHENVKSRFGLRIPVDCLADAVDASHFDAFVLPGGFHSHGYDEAYDRRVHELARVIHEVAANANSS